MTDVLFVDDDAATLALLTHRLKPLGSDWNPRFVAGPREALAALEQKPADVIISDFDMPVMDGAELMRRIRDRWPSSVRLILSGITDPDKLMRALPVTHQVLTKPCDVGQLQIVVARAGALQSRLYSPAVVSAVASLKSLPTVPKLYQALAAELDSGRCNAKSVATIIEQDMAMTLRLLQLVNSAFFGLGRKVTNIRDAVTLLGFEPIRSLVASAELFRSMSKICSPKGFSLEDEQAHAARVAGIAQTLLSDREQARTAFSAAILHDIGRVALAVALPEEYGRARELAAAEKLPAHEAEQRVFECTHAEIGAHVLALWGLPNALVEAVAFHHRPAQLPEGVFGVAGAVHVADAIDRLTHPGNNGDVDLNDRIDKFYLRGVGKLDQLPRWIEANRAAQAA